eukprot:43886-Pleurochrysis_carterae.AAC.1
MADPAAAAAPASDPAPADPPDAEAAAAAHIEHRKVWHEHHTVDVGGCRGHPLGLESMRVEERSGVERT